jgi:hypothetical protein
MRLFRVCLMFVVMAGMAGVAGAQVGIYGTFTGANLGLANTPWLYGGTVGVYRNQGYGLISAGVDLRGTFLRRALNPGAGSLTDQTLKSGLGGVRVAVTPHVLPIKPYVEGLVGVGHFEVGEGSARSVSTSFEYEVLGGLDFTFFPRLDWRVVEFGYGRLAGNGATLSPKMLSTGLVFRLP